MRYFLNVLLILVVSLMPSFSRAQSWQPMTNNGPSLAGVELLLLDGTVMVQQRGTSQWYRLAPDVNGSYMNGTWTALPPMPNAHAPLYFASAVLSDGRVVIIGGEYNNLSAVWSNKASVYDPVSNSWAIMTVPAGWVQIGDAQCTVMPNGHLYLANPLDTRMGDLDPATMTWTSIGTGKTDRFDEEGWTLLPNKTILTVDAINHPASELYIPWTGQWIFAGNTTADLTDAGSQEIGPAVLMYDGKVFATGATGHNSVYTPGPTPEIPGTWSAAPDFPVVNGAQLDIADGPACLLTNGHVLCGASPGVFLAGTKFFEWDGTSLISVPATPNSPGNPSYVGNMLMLPTGQVMYTDFSSNIQVYTSSGQFNDAWRPTITNVPINLAPGQDYVIEGTQFNGLSECCVYGDDSTNATNYPLVRVKNLATGHVTYCRTHDHSTMGVATGTLPVSTHFAVPATIETGISQIEVVANGIPSFPQVVVIGDGSLNGPIINSISPNTIEASSPRFILTVTGVQFMAGDVVTWKSGTTVTNLSTSFDSATQLRAGVPASLIENMGTAEVRIVRSPKSRSNGVPFTITTDTPQLNTITPSSVEANLPGFTLNLSGIRFKSTDKVKWTANGVTTELAMTFISPTQETAVVPTSLVLNQGTAVVTVVNKKNNASNGLTFTITTDTPQITSLLPSSTQAFGPAFTMTVNGLRFRAGDVVKWTSGATTTNLATTYISPTQVTAIVPAALIEFQGSATVTVTNARGNSSNGAVFTITSDAPLLSSLSPSTMTACGPDFAMSCFGSRFRFGDVVRWTVGATTTNLPTSFVSATQLDVVVPAALIANIGNATITVIDPRNQISNGLVFSITNPIPVLSSINPTSVPWGGNSTITLTGGCFTSSSVARFKYTGGTRTNLVTTYVNATTLTAVLPATLLVSPGSGSVDVSNPAPGGGTSAEVGITITGGNSITSISPSSGLINTAVTITVNGSGFDEGANVTFDGNEYATTYVSSARLTATIPATAITTAGNHSVQVLNDTGAESNIVIFTANNPGPHINSISPSQVAVGGAAFTLTVTGTGFVSGSVVRADGVSMATTFVSSTQLTAVIPASVISTTGNKVITIQSPGPGGGTSNNVNLKVQ